MLRSCTTDRPLPPLPWGSIPRRMSVLHVVSPQQNGDWLAESLAADSATSVLLETVAGAALAMQRLHEQPYDAVLVSHEQATLNAPELIAALRAGGNELPVLVLGTEAVLEIEAACLEAGADAYLCLPTTSTRSLIWALTRALERHALLRENRRLRQFEQRRLRAEHLEADRLLTQQRGLIRDLETLRGDAGNEQTALSVNDAGIDLTAADTMPANLATTVTADAVAPPSHFSARYREMLRAYVMMGSGNLTAELTDMAESLVSADVAAPAAMQWHVQAVEELVRGLGQRSSRHVLSRADSLVLELMSHLVEGYRRRGDVARRAA